jgi:hypothetical protein
MNRLHSTKNPSYYLKKKRLSKLLIGKFRQVLKIQNLTKSKDCYKLESNQIGNIIFNNGCKRKIWTDFKGS